MDVDKDHLADMPKWRAGAWGGFASSLAQFIGTSSVETVSALFDTDFVFVMKSISAFGIAAFGLGVLGAIVGRFCSVTSRWTIFLAGASATAILTMAAPALKPLVKMGEVSFISTANAATSDNCNDRAGFTVAKGLKNFFGLNDPQYRVIIGSFKRAEDANAFARKVNDGSPELKAVVVGKAPCNDHYAVSAGNGEYLAPSDAKKLQAKVLEVDGIAGAFLSPEP